MNFCADCGHPVEFRIPHGDTLPRYICKTCDSIHYQNPNIVAGCLLETEGQVLLCKRAIEPGYGLWTLPAGFMENAETTHAGAAREAHEEAHASSDQLSLFCLYNLPHINQVYMMFYGQLKDGYASPGEESLETELFSEADTPWEQIAFPVITESLQLFFSDRKRGNIGFHRGDIIKQATGEYKVIRY
ncbi:MAG: NUDIX hydrolase [Gammaproteobacteria bacterium]|nr:NUDIX hydrolase [Gammaproteobacteria bacterium]